jgi:hypothetical protein
MIVYALLAIFILGLALFTAQSALANIRVDYGGDVPFYARFEQYEIFHTDDWAVIVFYRPPGCIPADFNMFDFFDFPTSPEDPGAFGCNPATTEGFQIWKNGPAVDGGPIHTELHGLGAVPVWFVGWSELQGIMADGYVTIGELESTPSLMTGSATYFHETLHPFEAAKNSKINYVASGSLDGGGSFWVHASANSASGQFNVQVNLGD